MKTKIVESSHYIDEPLEFIFRKIRAGDSSSFLKIGDKGEPIAVIQSLLEQWAVELGESLPAEFYKEKTERHFGHRTQELIEKFQESTKIGRLGAVKQSDEERIDEQGKVGLKTLWGLEWRHKKRPPIEHYERLERALKNSGSLRLHNERDALNYIHQLTLRKI